MLATHSSYHQHGLGGAPFKNLESKARKIPTNNLTRVYMHMYDRCKEKAVCMHAIFQIHRHNPRDQLRVRANLRREQCRKGDAREEPGDARCAACTTRYALRNVVINPLSCLSVGHPPRAHIIGWCEAIPRMTWPRCSTQPGGCRPNPNSGCS